jgi:hypothetical protein
VSNESRKERRQRADAIFQERPELLEQAADAKELRFALVGCVGVMPGGVALGALMGAMCDVWLTVAKDKSSELLQEIVAACLSAIIEDRAVERQENEEHKTLH